MKRKSDNILIIIITVVCCVFFVFGLLYRMNTSDLGALGVFESLAAIFIGFLATIIVHECGHLVFGLLSGYGFCSFRVGNLMLYKSNGKYKFRRFKMVGTGGQCLLTPPEPKDGVYPIKLYMLGGVIFNLTLTALSTIFFLVCPDIPLLSITAFSTATLSLLIALTNGIPMVVSGIANDGLNARSMADDPMAVEALMTQLRINEAQTNGMSLAQMPKEWFELDRSADRTNPLLSSIKVFEVNRICAEGDPERAEREIELLLNGDWQILGVHRSLLILDLVTFKLINHGRNASINLYLTPELNAFTNSMKNYSSVIRTEYVAALIRNGDRSEAEKQRARFEKVAKNNPSTGALDDERRIMDMALAKYESIINGQ